MPAPYTIMNTSDATNVYTIFKFVNISSGGMFMPIMLLTVWIIAFIGAISEGRQASRSFIFASFFASALSIIMTLIGVLNRQFMYLTFLLVAAGIVWYKLDNAPGI